jgi:hypothetical protein
MKKILAFLALPFTLLFSTAPQAETWQFALIGDTPYSDYEQRELPLMFNDIAAANSAFIIHAGDFKTSTANCSNKLFLERRSLFDASRVPFIYVPGDNEWVDCRYVAAGGFDPLERLKKLRELFFAEPRSLGKRKIPVEQQPGAYPEHLRWVQGPVLFITLNVPGPNNNFGRELGPNTEFLARNPAVIDWIKQGFAVARRDKLAGVVITMQANLGLKHFAADLTHVGYRELLDTLRNETLAFPGQVLLLHGDTHAQRIDQPLRHPETKLPLKNFTRVETFGYPFMGWVEVIFDSDKPQLFHFKAHPYKQQIRN